MVKKNMELGKINWKQSCSGVPSTLVMQNLGKHVSNLSYSILALSPHSRQGQIHTRKIHGAFQNNPTHAAIINPLLCLSEQAELVHLYQSPCSHNPGLGFVLSHLKLSKTEEVRHKLLLFLFSFAFLGPST